MWRADEEEDAERKADEIEMKDDVSEPKDKTFRPHVVVFDLDACVWWPEMYMIRGGSPFAYDSASGTAKGDCSCPFFGFWRRLTPASRAQQPAIYLDKFGERVKLMGHVREIWRDLHLSDEWKANKTRVAIASRCDEPEWAHELLGKFEVAKVCIFLPLLPFISLCLRQHRAVLVSLRRARCAFW
jgi:hypothetical protein